MHLDNLFEAQPRQIDYTIVRELAMAGKTDTEIASELGISRPAVAAIIKKTGGLPTEIIALRKQKLSDAAKRRWADPKERQKHSDRMHRTWSGASSSARRAHSDAMRAIWTSPEYREKRGVPSERPVVPKISRPKTIKSPVVHAPAPTPQEPAKWANQEYRNNIIATLKQAYGAKQSWSDPTFISYIDGVIEAAKKYGSKYREIAYRRWKAHTFWQWVGKLDLIDRVPIMVDLVGQLNLKDREHIHWLVMKSINLNW